MLENTQNLIRKDTNKKREDGGKKWGQTAATEEEEKVCLCKNSSLNNRNIHQPCHTADFKMSLKWQNFPLISQISFTGQSRVWKIYFGESGCKVCVLYVVGVDIFHTVFTLFQLQLVFTFSTFYWLDLPEATFHPQTFNVFINKSTHTFGGVGGRAADSRINSIKQIYSQLNDKIPTQSNIIQFYKYLVFLIIISRWISFTL